VAVHSMKDLPALLAEGLVIGAVPEREDPRDALCSRAARSLGDLRRGARVGTSSLRRGAQLKALRPDLVIETIRGNVETRLNKVEQGFDAVVLAYAGLKRLGLDGRVSFLFDPAEMLPAVAQGALALEARADDVATLARLLPLEDADTRCRVEAERALLRRLEGGCQVPIAGHAVVEGGTLRLRALVASVDGTTVVRGERSGPTGAPVAVGEALAEDLLGKGAAAILEAAEAHATSLAAPRR